MPRVAGSPPIPLLPPRLIVVQLVARANDSAAEPHVSHGEVWVPRVRHHHRRRLEGVTHMYTRYQVTLWTIVR